MNKAHYLIDGYNLLFWLLRGESPFLRKNRERAIAQLADLFEFLPFRITLVFDSHKEREHSPLPGHFRYLEIIYTDRDQSADDYILQMIATSPKPQQIILITSDRELASQARARGARVEDRSHLFSLIKRKKGGEEPSEEMPVDSRREIQRLLRIFKEKLELGNLEE